MLSSVGATMANAAQFNGIVIREGGQVIASAWNGVAEGEIAVEHEEMSDSLFVTFLRPDSTEFVPGGSPTWTLNRSITDPLIASSSSLGDWVFQVTGDEDGQTTIVLSADSSGTTQYTSPPIELHVEEHFEAEGMILRSGGQVIASVWQGVVTGEIELEHDEMSDSIFVSFLDPDSMEVAGPDDPEFSMLVTIGNPAAVGFTQLGDWAFKLTGTLEGVDSLNVCIQHEGHCDFQSPWIEVHVEEHFEAEGMILRSGGQVIASVWQGVVTGEIELEHDEMSDSIFVSFLDPDSMEVAGPDDPEFSMQVTIGNPAAVGYTQLDDWVFKLTGTLEGVDSLTVCIEHEGHCDFQSPWIEVHVEEHFEAEGMILRSGGQVIASVWQGVVTGEIELEHEEMSDSIFVSFLDPDSMEVAGPDDPEFSMQVTIGNPAAVGYTQLDDWVFKLTGTLEGVDSLTVCIEHEGHCDFQSPWIEIHVEEHFEAEGLVVRQGGLEVVRVFQGVVTGDIDVALGGMTPLLDVTFLDDAGQEFAPPGEPEFSLTGVEADTMAISYEGTAQWQFRMHGLQTGVTMLELCVQHEGHCDFTASMIPVDVKSATDVGDPKLPEIMAVGNVTNPFRGSTTISYALGQRFPVNITVFDVRGRRVQILKQGVEEPGFHSVQWDARDLTSGLYFVRVTVPGMAQTQKLVLRK